MSRNRITEALLAVLMLLPSLVLFGAFVFYPLGRTFYLGLHQNDFFGGNQVYVGFKQMHALPTPISSHQGDFRIDQTISAKQTIFIRGTYKKRNVDNAPTSTQSLIAGPAHQPAGARRRPVRPGAPAPRPRASPAS